ncbi:MAG TPA: urease subunit beta [Candidatus Enterocloster faecavium]|uniref:Urease subunit beta n=1 Tax=Candidatus Enterocloster faecavium TaxID=2838560 RepID=A0A9D2L6H0_9FIRM|nr:urease subunit beta [Candidatus Enterocloster faecavium]
MKIGEIMPLDREIVLNEGKPTVTLMVANIGDRPIRVGSHYHFFQEYVLYFTFISKNGILRKAKI